MSDLYVLVVGTIMFILFNLIIHFIPDAWRQTLEAFTMTHWYIAPTLMILVLVGTPIILIWHTSRESGVPFRIVAQSMFEYIFGDDLTRRLSTLKLVITEKELEENK